MPVVSVATVQLCHCSVNTVMADTYMNERGCVPGKLYLQKQAATWIHPYFADLCL